jgi:hypothetical protein
VSGPKPLPLTGDCEGCGRPDGVAQPHIDTVYCPHCAAKSDNRDRARSHLSALIQPAVAAWRRHWIGRGIHPDLLVEMVENSDDLEDLVRVLNSRENPKSKAAIIP